MAVLSCAGCLLIAALAVAVEADDSPFASCRPSSAAGWTYEDLLCLSRTARQHRQPDEAQRRLRQLGAGRIDRPWETLVLAHATVDHHEADGVSLYALAADGFVRSGEADGEIIARQNLRNLYRLRGDLAAARRQVERAAAIAETAADPMTVARASIVQAAHEMETGGDIGRAHRALLRAERLVFPDGPIGLRRSILFNLANASLYLGRLDDTIAALERHRALREEDGSTIDAALVAFNLLNARVTVAEARPVSGARRRLVAEAEAVLAEAILLKHQAVQAQAHRVLGELTAPDHPQRAHDHFHRCLALEASLGYPSVRASCLWALARHESVRNPRHAERLSREALSLLSTTRGGPLLAYAWQSRLRLVWRTLPEDQAIAESLAALDAIERLRAEQEDGDNRATLFTNWTRDYYWLTGRLLQVQPPQVALALDVGERLRSRVLLDYLNQSGATLPPRPGRSDMVDQVAGSIAAIQRRLLSPIGGGPERRALLDQLALLELERAEAGGDRRPAGPDSDPFASLPSIRHALQEREAMLWFSLAPSLDLYGEFGGDAWVIAVTRHGATIHRLPAGVDLDSQVTAFVGLLRRRDAGKDAPIRAARHLGTVLLGDAVARLPRDVDRLVIVSDGVLHRLPFEALRIGAGVLAGDRFEITMVPSATIWLRLRQSRPPAAARAAFVLADPELPRDSADGEMRLEPLPWARREAKAIARLLNLDADLVVEGRAASERLLKTNAIGDVGVLHLAAHARADASFPERSAVFLAPGGEREDGWLQPHEIAALGLRGQLVVLSACDSADGPLLSGEGPLSLARAFFAGGAGGVVATRWPLRDDDAAFVMERFYGALAAGERVGAALRRARRDAIDAGLPPAAWAGVVLLGDGDRQPYPSGRSPSTRWPTVIIAVSLIVVALAGLRRARLRWQLPPAR